MPRLSVQRLFDGRQERLGLAFAAGAENLVLGRDIDPAPPAPMPCDVVQYMRDMRLPGLPASLVQRDD